MARPHNIARAKRQPIGCRTVVGNNRTIVRTDENRYEGYLLGDKVFEIVTFHDYCNIVLDHAGWRTETTRDAMADFASAFNVELRVSFARDEFTVAFTNLGEVTTRKGEANSPVIILRGVDFKKETN